MSCLECAQPLIGKRQKYCSDKCRYRARDHKRDYRTRTCVRCYLPIFRSPSSLPQGQAMCHACRRAEPQHLPTSKALRTPCLTCAQLSYGDHCQACYHEAFKVAAQGSVPTAKSIGNARRRQRDKNAPGLSYTSRRHLVLKWQRQGKQCAYCAHSVQCADHIVPLALGGTNYEGNLNPACFQCNRRKTDMLIVEWRHRKRPRISRDGFLV